MGERKRMHIEGDRLSVLPDDLILKILSFVGLKDVVQTSVLSSRWRFTWTLVPCLNFSSQDFSTMDKFSDFVTNVLSHRNSQVQLSSFNLYLRGEDGRDVAQRIMNRALTSLVNVHQVNITCLFGNFTCFSNKNVGFPLSLSSSQILKHLTLSRRCGFDYITLTSTEELLSLTTLDLDSIILYDGFIPKCPNLENLTLKCCSMAGSKALTICHPRLCNLTLDDGDFNAVTVNVVTPRLKNLTISRYFGKFQISAPELGSFLFQGPGPFMFSTDGFHSLEKAQLSLHSLRMLSSLDAPLIISLLQEFHNVKLLSLSMEIIQLLNSSVELISHQPSPLANLKSLKILPKNFCFWKHKRTRVIMSTEVKNYLLNGSPKATLTEVLREPCCDVAAGAALCYV